MYGLEAIGKANGWSMAILGILIVFTGLVTLSIIISQLHKILDLWENNGWMQKGRKQKGNSHTSILAEENVEPEYPHPYVDLANIDEVAEIWKPLVDELDSPFSLTELHALARKHKFPHPHLSINRLRKKHILVQAGNGLFEWNTDAE